MNTSTARPGFSLELSGLEGSAKQIKEYFWNDELGRRKQRDAVVVRGAFSELDVSVVEGHARGITTGTVTRELLGVDIILELVSDINQHIGAKSHDIRSVVGEGGVNDAHIDYDWTGIGLPSDHISRSKGITASLGISGLAMFGFNPIEKNWEDGSGSVFNGQGYPEMEDFRTRIYQHPGDLIIIRPGIVHMVDATKDRRSIIVTQENIL